MLFLRSTESRLLESIGGSEGGVISSIIAICYYVLGFMSKIRLTLGTALAQD